MAIDTPATILFIGAGPIGLEAALYARYLGYNVKIFEAGEVCQHVRQWEHVRMFSPFSMNHSPLGIAAIESHHPQHPFPEDDQYITGQQWLDSYLLPLADTDLLHSCISTHSRITDVSRTWVNKTDLETEGRRNDPFRVIIEQAGEQQVITADVVIDTSGVLSSPAPIGAGGIPAIGEEQLTNKIAHHIPSPSEAQSLKGKKVAVVGAGHSAACALVTLVRAGATVTWVTRGDSRNALTQIPDDPLGERVRIVQKLHALLDDKAIRRLPHTSIDSLQISDEQNPKSLQLGIYQQDVDDSNNKTNELHTTTLTWHSFDRVFGLTGYRVDNSIHKELQLHQCYATEGPIKLAASLLSQDNENCLEVHLESRELLKNPEPNFYQLGIKSYGRQSGFLFKTGLQQIVQLFQIIGDRETMDIYQTFSNS